MVLLKKFRVTQDLDYVVGHLRYGHKEGIVEVESEDELKEMIKSGKIFNYMDVEIDDYSIEDYDDGDNEVKWEQID